MSPARRSVTSRILVPVVAIAAATVLLMLLLVAQTVRTVRQDYDRLTVAAAAAHVTSILDLAASELTSARLDGNPVVVVAKQGTVRDAVAAFWSRSGLAGLIVDDQGRIIVTSLGAEATQAIASTPRSGPFVLDGAEGRLTCVSERFAPWGWTVVTAARRAPLEQVRPELALLLPLLAVGAGALATGVFLVLWRNLRNPVARMVTDVEADREVRSSGLHELDRIGTAVNSAVARLKVRSAELAAELDRRHLAEQALREKEERLRLLLESTAEGIYGMDLAGRCTFCNPAALRLLGRSSEADLLGQDAHRLLHHSRADGSPHPAAACRILEATMQQRGIRVIDEVFWRRDGTCFPVEYWSYPVFEEGRVTGTVVGFVDIAERLALEQQLRQSQKMEAVGRLAGGMAHDFNNMLTAIIGHATLVSEELGEGTPLRRDVDEVLAAAEKAAGLTRQILAFSRKHAVSLVPVDLNEVVLGMGRMMARLLGEDVEVAYRMASGELVAMADRGQLEQVLLNLWTNARDAMPTGGLLTIGTQAVAFEQAAAAAIGLPAAGRYALLAVSDSGVGMDEQTRQQVFEPFFTTKAHGQGTGLGLSIVYGIVMQHRGQIEVVSAPGRGTTIRIYLPLSREAVAPPAPAAPEVVRGGTETVLLAEDNEHVRTLARRVLEDAGYRVLEARDGREAVALDEAQGGKIALCLFDVVMPGMGGREALEAIQARRPGRRVLFMSGYAPNATGQPWPLDVPLLLKPFLPRDLLRRVREALDA